MSSKRVTKSLINSTLRFKVIAADGLNSTGGIQAVTLAGAAVGDRLIFVVGQLKAGASANSFLTPVVGTAFEFRVSVANQIQQLVAAGDLSASTFFFVLESARYTMQRP